MMEEHEDLGGAHADESEETRFTENNQGEEEDNFVSEPQENVEEGNQEGGEEEEEDEVNHTRQVLSSYASSSPPPQPSSSSSSSSTSTSSSLTDDKNKRRRIAVSVKQEPGSAKQEAASSRVVLPPSTSQKRPSPMSEDSRHSSRRERGSDDRKEDRRSREGVSREERIDRPLSSPHPQRGFAGYIFGCTSQTFDECMDLSILAGPRQMLRDVLQISAFDTPLFLFHISHRTLYGVFEATSQGAENLIPNAFQSVTRSVNPFPAQVAFRFKYQFLPLPEAKFGHLIPYHHNKPAASLSKDHVRILIHAFSENDASTAVRARDQLLLFFKV